MGEMKIKDLRQYRTICAEIDYIDSKLKGSKIHVSDSVQSAAKHPYSLHNVRIEGDIYERSSPSLLAKRQDLIAQKESIEQFINSIPIFKIRRALELYCIEPLGENLVSPTWEDVADAMADGSTAAALKMAAKRFLEKS